jgi:hypothetical protein
MFIRTSVREEGGNARLARFAGCVGKIQRKALVHKDAMTSLLSYAGSVDQRQAYLALDIDQRNIRHLSQSVESPN